MSQVGGLSALSLRGRAILTVLVVVVAALGASTYFSFRYWESQSLSASEEQALLAASSTRAALERDLRRGSRDRARLSLHRIVDGGPVIGARVYGPGGHILISADPAEESAAPSGVWIPDPSSLPRTGLARSAPNGQTVHAFLPLSAAGASVLELEFSVAPVRAAMRRGARLGIGLMAFSFLAVAILAMTMFERGVVAPLSRLGDMLDTDPDEAEQGRHGIQDLERSVARLVERKRAVEELVAAQEGLASVGKLATEMAHELKRPLASIRTALEMIEQEYELDPSVRTTLAAARGQLHLLNDTVGDLFSLARPLAVQPEPVDLVDVADRALVELAGAPGAERVDVRRDYEVDELEVPGDARRLRQAVVNLLINGVEAMPSGGTLTLGVRPLDDSRAEVRVSDTGPGLTDEEVERALRPFYSTKPLGTGLGLPLVARIVTAHSGSLLVEGRRGEGTTFRIVLPTEVTVPATPEE